MSIKKCILIFTLTILSFFVIADVRADELNEQLKQKNNEINNIYNSSSWRITKPIRKIIDMIRNIR